LRIRAPCISAVNDTRLSRGTALAGSAIIAEPESPARRISPPSLRWYHSKHPE
jgi:hypothetical protein